MRKRSLLIVFIAFVACFVLGLGLIVSGECVRHAVTAHYFSILESYSDGFNKAGNDFTNLGASGHTIEDINAFLKNLPESATSQSNVVIVGKDGVPVYKANDNYLYLDGGSLNMAWSNSYAVAMDASANEKHWYDVSNIGEMEYYYIDNPPDTTGQIRESPQDMCNMLDSYNDSGPEANVTINDPSKDGTQYYIMWFRSPEVDQAINTAAGSDYSPYATFADAAGVILIVLYWLLAPVWVFLDAKRRQTQPLPWALLVLLTNLVGLAVYWIYQAQNAKASPVCPKCGKAVNKSHVYCPWCGEPLAKECKGCGKALERDWVACPWCGKPVE